MPTDLLKPLWHRLDCDPPCFFAEEFRRVFSPCPKQVLDLRILEQTTSSLTAPCRECGTGHIGTVHRFVNRRNGTAACLLECPTCGPTRIEAAELVRWLVDIPKLLDLVISTVGGRGEPGEVVAGHLWRLGNVTWCGRPRETYFVRRLHEGSRGCVTAVLARHPKAALLFPTEDAGRKWTTASNPVLALESILTVDKAGLVLDVSGVESRLAAAGLLDAPRRKPLSAVAIERRTSRDCPRRSRGSSAKHESRRSPHATCRESSSFHPAHSNGISPRNLGWTSRMSVAA